MLKHLQHQRINHDPINEDKDANLVAVPKSADRSQGKQPGTLQGASSHAETGVSTTGACVTSDPSPPRRNRHETHASVSQRHNRPKTRLCAVHRVERPTEDLIRFVAGPTGALVADLKQNLPGRGVWVSADKASISEAVARKAFDRGLRQATKPNAHLPDEVEALLVKRALNALSLANKAGVALAGFTKIELAIQKQALSVLIQARDAAADGRDKLARKFGASCLKSAPEQRIVTILTTSQLSLAMGRSNVVHAGLTESGLARTFLFEANRLERYGQGFATTTTDGKHHVGNE